MSALPVWIEIVVAVALIVGAAFTLIGSWGLVKLGDLLKRLHGPSKATTLGVGSVVVASAIAFAATGRASFHEILILVFVFITAPVSAHLVVKAGIAGQPSLRPPPPERGAERAD